MISRVEPQGPQQRQSSTHDGDKVMPIAVVGMGFRGPGEATSVEEFWKMISEAREAWSPIPKEKWNNDAFYHPDGNRNGTSNVKGGHFFTDDLARFDAPFFNMTNAEAEALDPQQRLLLECTYEALENSGTPLDRALGSNTSVFVGSFCGDYTDVLMRDPESVPLYQATSSGHSRAIISNRLSYFFDFKGPSVTIDTACSSSLVALHMACQSLRTGESKQAVVSGANVILSHEITISMSMMRFLSPDGRCYTFDDRANGYSRGEGVGCVLLKPLDEALKDGDTIRGVIRNTGVNQDGRTAGISLPNRQAQEDLIESVYAKVGLDPLETSFVECHGTGTPAGDPLETAAISNVFGKNRSHDQPLRIGSVKANVGHLEGASGVAGVIKSILMLENDIILPNRNFVNGNPQIPFYDWNLTVPTTVQSWNTDGPRRVSINSFGYGGTNSHAVLEDARGYLQSRGVSGRLSKTFSNITQPAALDRLTNGHAADDTNGFTNGHSNGNSNHETVIDDSATRLYLLSAFDEIAGKNQAKSLSKYLGDRLTNIDDQFMVNLAYTLGERRSKFPWKAVVPASSADELIEKLNDSTLKFTRSTAVPGLAFAFTGQGTQWHAMGRELIKAYPVFRNTLFEIGKYLKSIGASWDVIDELNKDAKESQVAILSQPLCTAIQIALVELFASWKIRPIAVSGHSSGEIAAAYTVGALTMEDAMTAAYYRGIYSNDMRRRGELDGAMMAVGMSREAVLPLLSTLARGRVTVACENSPSSVTISGDAPAVTELEDILKQKGIFARKLPVQVAYHSHHMITISKEYLAAISHIKARTTHSQVEFFSSVTGRRAEASDLGPSYWVSNLLGEVKFADSLLHLVLEATGGKKTRKRKAASAVHTIIEIGPHSGLAGPIKQILQAEPRLRDNPVLYQTALVRNSNAVETILFLVSKLLTVGYPITLAECNRLTDGKSHSVVVDLPSYVWNRSKSYWAESRLSKAYRHRAYPRIDLLGLPDRNTNPLEPRWRNVIRASEIPWIKDHKVQTNVVYPAAGYLIMAVEAAHQRATERGVNINGYRLREVSIGQALVIPEQSGEVETVITLRPYLESTRSPSDVWDEFCVFSVTEDERWTEHCRGLVSVQKNSSSNEVDGEAQMQSEAAEILLTTSSISAGCKSEVDVPAFYEQLQALGLEYGSTFANVKSARVAPNMCVSTISLPDTAATMPMGFQYPFVLHPAALDSMFHGLFAALTAISGPLTDPMVPVFMEELFVASGTPTVPGHQLMVYTSTERKDNRQINASMTVISEGSIDNKPAVTIKGLTCTTLASDTLGQSTSEAKSIAYNMKWDADVDMLSSADVSELCADIQPPADEQSRIRALEQAGFYFMEHALKQLSPDEVSNMIPYHKRQWACMKTFVTAVQQEQLGIPTASWKAASVGERAEHIKQVIASGAEGDLLCQVGRNLSIIHRREADALQLMIEEGRLDAYYRDNARFDRNYQAAAKYFDVLGHKNPHLKILEVGAGTGGATLPVLEALGGANDDLPRFARFDFTDISSGFFDAAKEKLGPWMDLITFNKLDIESDPEPQGYDSGTYDVVLAANVLHATKSMHRTMSNVRKLLKPGGKLVLIELTRERMTTSTIFGTLPGWWAGEDDGRTKGPTLTEEEWVPVLQKAGYSGLEAAVWDSPEEAEHQGSMMVAMAVEKESVQGVPDILLINDATTAGFSLDPLIAKLVESQATVGVESLTAVNPAGKLCIVTTEIISPLLSEPSSEQFEAIKKIFTTAAGVLWVTRGGQISSNNPASNLINGLARTVRSEYGGSRVVILDLDPGEALSASTAHQILALFENHFGQNAYTINSIDVEYAQRNGRILIPRLVENRDVNKSINSIIGETVPEPQPFYQPGRPLVMEVGTPGLLDSIHFVDDERVKMPLPDDYVEIEVKATGFNFKDVMMAMGQVEVDQLGLECSGIVHAVGKSVKNVVPGNRVSFFAFGAFSNLCRVEAIQAQKLPEDMPFELAASLPVIYSTAYYSVYHAANVRKGDTVLIHAASGGLGQATIELCQMIGAEVFATVGTVQKKELLMNQFGLPEDHIFSSRDSSFAKGIMRMTNGNGVDVIMNSVAGEMLRITWECIAPFGRFIELGARDYTINTRLEMHKFARNVTFAVVNLVSLVRERPRIAAQVWSDVMDLFRTKELSGPRPITVYGYSEIEKALRAMQSGRHMGKLVAVAQPNEFVKAIPQDSSSSLLRPDASYLLVGGLGGLGRAMALWMIERGARNLIFASRSGLKKAEAREVVKQLEDKGATIAVHACDVSDTSDVASVIAKSLRMPPIRGVIQGAMVLQDSLLENMTLADYEAAIRPKVQGTWNLHNQLPRELDFFLMLSSTSGIIGNASQAAYAAASTFLDAFANYRNGLGLAAATLDLGVILDVGYVAENKDLAKNLERQGFEGTSEDELMALIENTITHPRRETPLCQTVTGLGTWSEARGSTFSGPMFSHFRRMALKSKGGSSGRDGDAKGRVRDLLREVTTLKDAAALVCEAVIGKISSLSMIPVDEISEARPISEFGMDSLVAVEMRNWLFREMDATVPILELLANNPLAALATKIAKRSKLVNPAVLAKSGEE